MNPRGPLDVPPITNVDLLCKPSNYPDRPNSVEAIEAHMSWVFLTMHHAYKLKKSVPSTFSTIETRRLHCEAEVTLNHRPTSGAYLGTVPLTLTNDDQLCLHGDGVVVEWLV